MLRHARAALGAAALLGGLVVAPASAGAATPGPDDGIHRGRGWYDADLRIPEPPLALALVIIGAAAMRLRDRRRARG
ncbi:MAG: hypothetical protein KC486_25740 [Myxococcales bacterium]|nr:hypothetical protein [Myxococcales bacterium]